MNKPSPASPCAPSPDHGELPSARLEQILREETWMPPESMKLLVQHLAQIEAMEGRIASPETSPAQIDELVACCHRLVNEAHCLQLSEQLRRATQTAHPFPAAPIQPAATGQAR